MTKIEVRKPFRFLPALAWAVAIDATDLTLGWIPVIGEFMDVLQTLAAFALFEDPQVALLGASDFLLVGPLDLIPTWTAAYFVVKYDLLKNLKG